MLGKSSEHIEMEKSSLNFNCLFVCKYLSKPSLTAIKGMNGRPGIDLLSPNESTRYYIRRINGFIFEQMTAYHIKRMILVPV